MSALTPDEQYSFKKFKERVDIMSREFITSKDDVGKNDAINRIKNIKVPKIGNETNLEKEKNAYADAIITQIQNGSTSTIISDKNTMSNLGLPSGFSSSNLKSTHANPFEDEQQEHYRRLREYNLVAKALVERINNDFVNHINNEIGEKEFDDLMMMQKVGPNSLTQILPDREIEESTFRVAEQSEQKKNEILPPEPSQYIVPIDLPIVPIDLPEEPVIVKPRKSKPSAPLTMAYTKLRERRKPMVATKIVINEFYIYVPNKDVFKPYDPSKESFDVLIGSPVTPVGPKGAKVTAVPKTVVGFSDNTIISYIRPNMLYNGKILLDVDECAEKFHELVHTATPSKNLGDVGVQRDVGDMFNKTLFDNPPNAKGVTNVNFWSDYFKVLNYSINMADCQKDGTPMSNLINFKAHGQFQGIDYSKAQLKQMIHAIKRHYLLTGEIKRVLVARSDKGNEATYKHFDDVKNIIAYDCGYLGFLRSSNYNIVQTFGKYIDPSSSRDNQESFPEENKRLEIDKNTFECLGYRESMLYGAFCKGKDKYQYDIDIARTKLVNPKNPASKISERKNDVNINTIFVGNSKKNTNDIVSVLGKNMGDKLQVFIQFINYTINKDRVPKQYSVATCDEVVLLLCMILNLPCFYTSIDEVELNGKKDVKVNEILHYDPDGANFGNALKRFIEEYKVVDGEYEEMINLLRITKNNQIFLKGHNVSVPLHPLLADLIIDDLTEIRNYIKKNIFDAGIIYFKKKHDVERVPLVSKDPTKVPSIKIATQYMSALTTRIIDMCPNPVIKYRDVKKTEIMFNQTTGTYYDYGANEDMRGESGDSLDDTVLLEKIIHKKTILDFYEKTKTSVHANIRTLPFSDIALAFSKFDVAYVTKAVAHATKAGGGKNLKNYISSENEKEGFSVYLDYENGYCEQDLQYCPVNVILSPPPNPEKLGALALLQTTYSDEKASVSDEKASASDEKASASDEKASASDEKASASDAKASASDAKLLGFNIHEKYYDELYKIYETIHTDYGGDVQFDLDEYLSTMESVLFKIRHYDTTTLTENMTMLQSKFLLEFTHNAQIQLAVNAKMAVHNEVVTKYHKTQAEVALKKISDPPINLGLQVKESEGMHEGTSVADMGSQPEDYGWKYEERVVFPDVSKKDLVLGGDSKTRKRHKQTHKRARKLRNRITKRRMKRGQKRNKTR